MGQSLVQLYSHVVFSTKGRQPFLADVHLRTSTHAYLAGACKNLDSPAIIIGGVEDHVHILCRLGKQSTISDVVREIKRDSSKWIKAHDSNLSQFSWQGGYGAFSISPGHLDELKTYIANQVDHHRRENFQDEFRRICRKYGVEINEEYIWE